MQSGTTAARDFGVGIQSDAVGDMHSAQVRTSALSSPYLMSGVSVPSSCSVESPGFIAGSTMSRTCSSRGKTAESAESPTVT